MSRYETHAQPFGGGPRQQTERVLIAEPSAPFSPEARKGRLYIVAESAHESTRERDACQAVIRAIRKSFYEDSSYSITSSLSKAINKANELLYGQNFSMAVHKRVFIGVTCAVLKEQSLYVAQVQPAQAYMLAEGKLRSLPPNPAWSGGLDPSVAALKPNALGASLTIEPAFYRTTVRLGDGLILGTSGFAPHLRREVAEYLLRLDDSQSVADELVRFGEDHDLAQAHGIVLRVQADKRPAEMPSEPAKSREPKQPTAISRLAQTIEQALKGSQGRGRDEKKALRRDHAAREGKQLNTMHEDPPPPPREDLRVAPIEIGESLEERMNRVHNERMTRLGSLPARPTEHELTPSSFLGEGDYIVPEAAQPVNLRDRSPKDTFTSYARRSHGQIPELEPTMGERLASPFTRVAASARIAAANRKRRKQMPPSALPPKRRNAGLSYRKEGPRFPWLQLALLALVVTLLVVVGYNQLEQNTREEQTTMLDDARAAVAALRAAPDEATALTLLEEAGIALDTVRSSGAISDSQQLRQDFVGLEREYERVQASVQRLSYFEDLTEVGAHPQADSGSTFSTLIVPPPATSITNTVGFESIYALDTAAGTVYQMPKSGDTMAPMLQPDQNIADGILAGPVRALAWRIDNIVAVGQAQGSYVYYFRDNNNWRSSNLGGSNEWRQDLNRLRFASYAGNLYFWGALPAQLLRYESGQPGNLYSAWISNYGTSDIESALDLAIDGRVFLLRPDGRVQMFEANSFLRELPAPRVEPAIVAATAFVVTGNYDQAGFIFYLEQNRIIQADKETGEIVQQMRVRPDSPIQLDGMTTITVDNSGPLPILYLVNNGRIYRASVPQPPKPFVPTEATATPE